MATGGSEWETRNPRGAQHRIVGMHQGARRGAGEEVADHHAAMLENEYVAQDQGLAAGAEEAEHLPVVNDLHLGERHQEIGDVAGVALVFEEGPDDRPLRIVAAARERVTPAEPPTARHPSGRLARRQGG